jgi:hypothetical protein
LILIAHFFGIDDANGMILVLKPLPDKIEFIPNSIEFRADVTIDEIPPNPP